MKNNSAPRKPLAENLVFKFPTKDFRFKDESTELVKEPMTRSGNTERGEKENLSKTKT